MICQICTNETKVIYSKREARAIRRRRECLCCKNRFYTSETLEGPGQSSQENEKELEKFRRTQKKAFNSIHETLTSVREMGWHIGISEDT